MKRLMIRGISFVVVSVTLLFPLFVVSCNEERKVSSSEISSTDSTGSVIRAVTENAYPPLNFVDEQGKGIGLEYDLTNKIAEMLGMRVEWHLASWDVMLQSIREGAYDVAMDGISITDERRKEVDFSISYFKSHQIQFVRNQEERFSNLKGFVQNGDLKVASQIGTTQFLELCKILNYSPENPGPRIVLFENLGASIQGLLSGDVDMLTAGVLNSQEYVKSTGGRLRILDEIIPSKGEGIAFAFPKGSSLVVLFDEAIGKLKADGTLDEMIKKWVSD